MPTRCSTLSSPPNPAAWAWDSRSAARSWKLMGDDCGRPGASRGVLSFSLRSPLTEPPSVIDVAYWHQTDMPTVFRDVRFQGQSGKHLLALSFSGFDPGRVKTCARGPEPDIRSGERRHLARIKLLSAKGRLVASPCASVS